MMMFFSRILITSEKLKALPHQKVDAPGGQAGWERALEAGSLLIHDADSACLWAVLDYPTWPLRHARETSISDGQNILTLPQYSPTWQQQGWASTRSMGRSKRGLGHSWLSSKLLGALAMPSTDSVPEQQTHQRHISSNTRRLT